MAATVWYVPGWMRSEVPQEGVMPAMSNAFPKAEIAFKAWDGDKAVRPLAVESADKEAWHLAFEIATMPKEERENLTLVGHSLGGRIAARVLARLAEKETVLSRNMNLQISRHSRFLPCGKYDITLEKLRNNRYFYRSKRRTPYGLRRYGRDRMRNTDSAPGQTIFRSMR